MNQKGYLLIEVMVAGLLLSLAGSGFYMGLVQGLKADQRIRRGQGIYDPFRRFEMRIEKDLRNAVVLRDYPFKGKNGDMSFPVLEINSASGGDALPQLFLIRYIASDGQMIRSRREISNKPVREDPRARVVLGGLRRADFLYSYLDEKDRPEFRPYWLEEPYFGIPRAVKVEFETIPGGRPFVKLIAVPHGRWGRPQGEGMEGEKAE